MSIKGTHYYDNRHKNFFYALEEVEGTGIIIGVKTKEPFYGDYYGDKLNEKKYGYVTYYKDLTELTKRRFSEKVYSSEDKIVGKINKMMDYAANNNQKRLRAKCVKFLINIAERNAKGRIKI